MLCGRASAIESAWRIAERPFDRTHESRRVEVRLAGLTDGATRIPARIDERNTRNQIRTDGTNVPIHSDAIVVTQDCDERYPTLNAPDAAQAPTADQVLNDARRILEEGSAATDRQIPQERRAERVLDVEERDRTVGRKRRAVVDVANRAHVEVDEPHIARVRRVVKTFAESVVDCVAQPLVMTPADANRPGVADAVGRRVEDLVEKLEAQILRSQIRWREIDRRPARQETSQRIIDVWIERIEATIRVGVDDRRWNQIDVCRRQKEMRAFAA